MGDQRRGSAEVAGYPRVAETIDRIVRDRGDCQDCPAEQAEAGCSGNWEDAALKHADGEKDEDVVPWKALLINNWKEKNNDVERRASEANSSLTEREIAIDERKQEVEERKLKMEELHKTKMGNVGGTAGEGGGLTIEKCEARMDALKQDIVDAKVEGDDEAVEMLRGTLKKAREKYCKMVEEEME